MAKRSHSKGSIISEVNSRLILIVSFILLALLLGTQPVYAAKTLNYAVRKAEKNGNSKVISARTVEKNNKRTHEVRVLTDKGKLKTMRYPANGAKQNTAQKPRKKNKDK